MYAVHNACRAADGTVVDCKVWEERGLKAQDTKLLAGVM